MDRRLMKTITAVIMVAALAFALTADTRCGALKNYIYGLMDQTVTYSSANFYRDGFYYTDDWFGRDPGEKNDALALLSMQMISAGRIDDTMHLYPVYEKLGFKENGAVGLDSDDDIYCSYYWGRKKLELNGEASELVSVVILSYSTSGRGEGWEQNFMVNGEGAGAEHYAFSKAADEVIDDIMGLASGDNTKYWITGQSRGGAIADLLGKRIGDRIGTDRGLVYTYTFEAPNVVEAAAAEETQGRYTYIHNYICDDDIVPRVPAWGMTKYGNIYQLNTEQTDEGLQEKLKAIGSVLGDRPVDPENRKIADSMEKAFVEAIPTREDYSRDFTVKVLDEAGEELEVTYNYQDIMRRIFFIAMGGGIKGAEGLSSLFSMTSFSENAAALLKLAGDLAYSVREDDADARYRVAAGLKGVLDEHGVDLGFSEGDIYALLKIAGPFIVNTDYVYNEGDEIMGLGSLLKVFGPLLTIRDKGMQAIYSHSFDITVLRLKKLAPMPSA